MSDAVSRELILPALRLDVPPKPTAQQVRAFAERSPDLWTTGAREWVTQLVTRLAVAEVLRARMEQGIALPLEHHPLPDDPTGPSGATLAQLVPYFRPHVGLAAQAFRIGVIEAVNARVPAVVDPLREGLRKVGVTGKDPLKVVAIGHDKVPERARSDFWKGVRNKPAVTALVDALAGPSESRDLSGLDRSHLERADVAVLGGGRATAAYVGVRPRPEKAQRSGKSWLPVPIGLTHRSTESRRPRNDDPVEIHLRASSWVEVFETALDAVGRAMQQMDSGAGGQVRPTGSRGALTDALAQRLAAARDRPVTDVVASLRDIDPMALEMFDHQVTSSGVRVGVPVIDDDAFTQLWLPKSVLAGPLFTGSADLFMGDGADVRTPGPSQSKPSQSKQGPSHSSDRSRPKSSGRPPGPKGRRGGGRGAGAKPTPPSTPGPTE